MVKKLKPELLVGMENAPAYFSLFYLLLAKGFYSHVHVNMIWLTSLLDKEKLYNAVYIVKLQ